MRFFFPNSNDVIDPSFDFVHETRSKWRIPQRDDLYPHQIFDEAPYNGILLSKSIVDGIGSLGGKFSLSQKHRIYRTGVKKYFSIDDPSIKTMGDCGAFTYVNEIDPPVTPEQVVDFYGSCQFDYGLSVDHVILSYKPEYDSAMPGVDVVPEDWVYRRNKTLELAADFLDLSRKSDYNFVPVGVAQGWSPKSYKDSVMKLQDMGYEYIALGGMVPLKTPSVIEILTSIHKDLGKKVSLHLLGITRIDFIKEFASYGVTSFDSTSPFRQAFKDARNNYHFGSKRYRAIRIPQTEGNAKLMSRIKSGEVNQENAIRLEKQCLETIRSYDEGNNSVEEVLEVIREYENVHSLGTSQAMFYEEVLQDKPWKLCGCNICEDIGVEVIIFRGSERNKRRGFHNLNNFYNSLQNI